MNLPGSDVITKGLAKPVRRMSVSTSFTNTLKLGSAIILAVIASTATSVAPAASTDGNVSTSTPRTIITTDPELDDNNSLIRLLLYSNELHIDGLITSSSEPHWKGDGQGTPYTGEVEADRFGLDLCPCSEWRWYDHHIQDVLAGYEKVYENLATHDSRYPTPTYLRSLVRLGNVSFPGDISQITPGSELITKALLDEKPGKIYLQVWGGPSTVARALMTIEEQFSDSPNWSEIQRAVSEKAVIIAFGEQDNSYREYIAKSWPAVPFWQLASYTWGYNARNVVLRGDETYLSPEWHAENVLNRPGLGSLYRVWGDGQQMVKDDVFDYFGYAGKTASQLKRDGYIVWTPVQEPGAWISEGDTSAFLNLLDNGLRSYEHPGWGGWGGRAKQDAKNPALWTGNAMSLWTGSGGVKDYDEFNGARAEYSVARWFAAAQQDFAARLAWTTEPNYASANHHPVVEDTQTEHRVQPGGVIKLSAKASDPDGDALSLRWWQYREAGTYPEFAKISSPSSADIKVTIPNDVEAEQTIHIILEVTDSGTPTLRKYQRHVLTVN